MTAEHSEIRALIERWVSSVRRRDLEGITATYAPDVVAFDAIGPLRFTCRASYREHWQRCQEQVRGEPLLEMNDLRIEQDGALACAYGLCHCGCANEKGEMESAWMRFTQVLRRIDGQWLIVHEHWSAPFDPQSGQAHFDLQPE